MKTKFILVFTFVLGTLVGALLQNVGTPAVELEYDLKADRPVGEIQWGPNAESELADFMGTVEEGQVVVGRRGPSLKKGNQTWNLSVLKNPGDHAWKRVMNREYFRIWENRSSD